MPGGAIAKLHSLVRSNSAALLVVHDRTRQRHRVLARQAAACETLVTLPSIFIAGGNSAVRNRSEPFARDQQAQQVVDEFGCLVTFHEERSLRGRGPPVGVVVS